MSDSKINGGCLCGQVQFELNLPSKWVAHCHCTMCQKSHGAGYVTWAGFEEENFNISKGSQRLKWYKSSKSALRGFCKECGSTMFFKSTQWPGEIHVTLANIDGELDKAPQANAYFANHVDWMPIDATLKCLE